MLRVSHLSIVVVLQQRQVCTSFYNGNENLQVLSKQRKTAEMRMKGTAFLNKARGRESKNPQKALLPFFFFGLQGKPSFGLFSISKKLLQTPDEGTALVPSVLTGKFPSARSCCRRQTKALLWYLLC